MSDLMAEWLAAKEAEKGATEKRRDLEDKMVSLFGIHETSEGTTTKKMNGYTVTITNRMNRKIDSEKLQELASEAGLSAYLGSLFRWKPEINAAAWKSSDESITKPLLGAITTTPGRPSFAITQEI